MIAVSSTEMNRYNKRTSVLQMRKFRDISNKLIFFFLSLMKTKVHSTKDVSKEN